MKEIIHPSELFHIWKSQPCQAGDTLSGGERVQNLVRQGLISATNEGYVVTQKGQYIIQRMIEYLDKRGIVIVTDISDLYQPATTK